MKLIAIIASLFICITAIAQKKDATMRDLQGLPGNWAGKIIYTDYSDDTKQVTLPAALVINARVDSLELKFTYTASNGKAVNTGSSLHIYSDGQQLWYDGYEYDIDAVRRMGDKLTIIADREGKDNNKDADIRETFIIGTGIFNVHKEIKYEGAAKYITRNWLQFIKK